MLLSFFLFILNSFSEPQEYSLSNDYLTVTWSTNDQGQINTKELINKRSNPEVKIAPQTGTSEFTLSILRETAQPYPKPISDKSSWKISTNSVKNKEGSDGPIENLIDNDPNTIWHSWESESDDKNGYDNRVNHTGEYNITIDFSKKTSFKAISFRQKPVNLDGVVRKFKLFSGDSIEEVTEKVQKNQFVLDSYFQQDKNKMCFLNLSEEVNCQFVVMTTKGDGKFATGSQFDVYEEFLPYVNDVIESNELKVKNVEKSDDKITINYDTFDLNDIKYDIVEIVELIKDKPYMEKHFEIKISDENVKVDYIDLDHYKLSNEDIDKSWGCPFVDELFMSLGQPYYMNTFYAGCRFPYTHTMIESSTNIARIRYYSGKSFKDLNKNDQGFYVTWKTVLGAARDSRIEVVRNDFFSYISDISVRSPFRKQYNSWYDWMLKITDENIMTSFKEIERGCSQYGLPPFDSYVVDDGWNNYNSDKYGVYDVGTSGTTYNQDGFWEFNNKFPNKFTKPSDFTRKISSNFGVWLGPRGGYVTPGKFGRMIEDANKGFYNPQSDDIDVGSHTYLRNVQKLLVDFIKTYKVNYYKLDGFVEQPCFNETHDHVAGGPDGLYFFTDLWENVYIWYEDMIKTAKDVGLDNFWISTTTWAAPSPFQLQWSNSVWIQISGDKGEIVIGDNINQADQMLTYRDDCYWQFYDEMELQFPARCLYNHDPIYGQAGTTLRGSLNDDFFRTFLYGCAMRGTAFFELYYTYDMLDEGDKWYISSDVLSWAEKNFDTLQHSQIFGGRPGIGEFYGFSAWNDTNGVIGIRNPGTVNAEETIILDRNIGVPENIGTVYRSTLLDHKTDNKDETKNKVPFKYGEELKVTLIPGEYRIYEFKPKNDEDIPSIEVVKTTKETEIMIRFNKRVNLESASFTVNNDVKITDTRLRGDRRTVTLTTSPMKNYTNYQLSIKGVKDIFDNELTTTVDFQYFASNLIAGIRGEFSGSNSVIVDTTVETDSFTIRLKLKDLKDTKNTVLIHSEDNSIVAEITDDNHLKFTVDSVSVTSESAIDKDTKFITFVRERNALIKIYINDDIDSSVWDKNVKNTVKLHNLILNKNDIVYSYVKVFNYGLAYSEISGEISLKNEYIERVFSVSNNKVKTIEINNYRTDSLISIKPQEGTEEFIFSIPAYPESNDINDDGVEKVYRVKNDSPVSIDRSNWKVHSNSEQSTVPGKEGSAYNLIDGNLNTIWHSKYDDKGVGGHDDRSNSSDPFQVTFDLGKETSFKAFSYTPRQSGPNGVIHHYEIYVENTMEELNKSIADNKYKMKGDFKYLSVFPVYVNFTNAQTGRFVALLSVNHDSFGSGADFSLYTDFVPLPYADIKSSSFELDNYELVTKDNSQLLTFKYKPYVFNGIQFNITVEYELQNGKHYIEKEITIQIPHNKFNDFNIDYLELDRIVISNEDKENSWTHPFIDPTRNDLLTKYIISLGQPVYINSFFTGCRFPFSDNQIVDNIAYNRYQAGKTFGNLKVDDSGSYHCWKTVIGSARSQSIEVIRNDFYSYITDISVENKFRKQYNSWYDWMKKITESNILSSFKEIEKGCTQMGVKPLDSYVIDDGWNNYNSEKYKVYNEAESGTTYNDVGFWTMNTKFPDGFNKPSDFSHSVSSNFGVWLGPRGGYGYNSAFGHMVEDAGFGYFNAQNNDIDVASKKYTEKLGDFWNDWIKQYKVNYYKLDGWLLHPCNNKQHDHVVGGYDNVFEYTDYWERYIDVFKSMRKTAEDNEINDLWISLTCYINPSPFHLQWTNSIWVQISNDVGYTKLSDKDTLADQMLNYRDNVYYDFYTKYQFQLPQHSVYNHDPIYGKEGTQLEGSLNDDEFRKYLLMCGMRGTSFFELYYTYTMIDEGDKWYINSEVLNYIEKRHSILEHSQIFGDAPGTGNVYGYSAWSNERGTIAIRNPSNEVKDFSFKLNREIGVPENIPTTYRKIVLNFNTIEDLKEGQEQKYDDEIKVTLQPREVRIIDFEPEQDTNCAEVEVIKAINQKEIQIRFNKKIQFDINNYQINDDKVTDGKLRGDLRTVSLYLSNQLINNTKYTIKLAGVKDSIGNVLDIELNYIYMAGNMIVTVPNEIGPIEEDTLLSAKEFLVDSFTIQLNIKEINQQSNFVIIKDDANDVSVEVVDKHIKFRVQSVFVLSKQEINLKENLNITCVRERNTMVKIYINGVLSSSSFMDNQDETMKLQHIQICKSDVVFNSILIASYAFSYKDALELNEKIIRVETAVADATSQQKDHEAFYAIDDNEVTYWLSEEGESQSIKITLDRNVFIEKIGYVPHDDKTSINDYVISMSIDGSSWEDISGSWSNQNDQKVAEINKESRFVRLAGSSSSKSISAAQIYLYGYEIENEDLDPTLPPPPTPRPTPLPTPESGSFEPSDEPEPDDEKSKERAFLIVGIAIGVVSIIATVILIIVLLRKKKSQEILNAEPLLTVENK